MFVETVNWALAVGPDADSVRVVGLSVMLGGWVALELGSEAWRLMLPVKLLTLARSSLKVVESPACNTADESEEASRE